MVTLSGALGFYFTALQRDRGRLEERIVLYDGAGNWLLVLPGHRGRSTNRGSCRFLWHVHVDYCGLGVCQNVLGVGFSTLQTAVGRLRLLETIDVLAHLQARRRVLLIPALVVPVLRQLFQELFLECQCQLIDANVEVSRCLRVDLLVLFNIDSQGLRLGEQFVRRQGLLLLLQLLQLDLLYLRALLLLLSHHLWVGLVVGHLPIVSKLSYTTLVLFHYLVHGWRHLLMIWIADSATARGERNSTGAATFDLALTFVDNGANS